jgi:4-hydroxythreonine-4-phosphate dehydrogenase
LVKIGITIGDPSGIGPEIVVRALQARHDRQDLRVYGDRRVLERIARLPDDVDLVEVTRLAEHEARLGQPDRAGGAAQVAYLEAAVADAKRGAIQALCTAPIHKAQAQSAGFAFPGHTEFLADRFAAPEVAMLFAGPRLRVVLATIHVGIARLPAALTQEAIVSSTHLAARALQRDFGIVRPRIGVLGLNPHAGEGGRFGREEIDTIAPAVARLRGELGDEAILSGPLVPDAIWRDALDFARYDLVVAMYHDQGLIPVKAIDFEDSVNVTLGLPIVRTSPDHGTAYDVAAAVGTARPGSFLAALALAGSLGHSRLRNSGRP